MAENAFNSWHQHETPRLDPAHGPCVPTLHSITSFCLSPVVHAIRCMVGNCRQAAACAGFQSWVTGVQYWSSSMPESAAVRQMLVQGPQGTDDVTMGPPWLEHCDMQAKQMDALRIMRSYVRKVLLSRVPPDAVQFGRSCVSATPASKPGEPVQITLADGSTEECDLLVVADGANGKLRTALLPHETNQYAGVCMLFVSPGWCIYAGRNLCILECKPGPLQSYIALECKPMDCSWTYLLVGIRVSANIEMAMGSIARSFTHHCLSPCMPGCQARIPSFACASLLAWVWCPL